MICAIPYPWVTCQQLDQGKATCPGEHFLQALNFGFNHNFVTYVFQ